MTQGALFTDYVRTPKAQARQHHNEQSKEAHKRASVHASAWHQAIYNAAVSAGTDGITLLEFVDQQNRTRHPDHRLAPNDISGRFSELGEGREVGGSFLQLRKLTGEDQKRVTRGGAGIWVAVEAAR